MALSVGALAATVIPSPAAAATRPVTTEHTIHPSHVQSVTARGLAVADAAVRHVTTTGTALAPGAGYGAARGSALVRALQWLLARRGDHPGPIDGRYGPLTEHAVARFQASLGLVADGIAGPRTVAALVSRTPLLYPGAGYATEGGSPSVRALQDRLLRLGFDPGRLDGRYGPRTTSAVERFQRSHRLLTDGVVGMQTGAVLWAAARSTLERKPVIRRITAARRPAPMPAPRANPQPATVPRAPTPPVGVLLIAMAVLGLGTAAISYRRTKEKVRRAGGLSRARTEVQP